MRKFLDGGRVVFTVNNLTNKFGEFKVFSSDRMELEQFGPDDSPISGRVFNLSVQMSIDGN